MRNIDAELIQIPLDKGMDQSFHERASPPGTLSIVRNARLNQRGALEKRPGSRAIRPGTPIDTAHAIIVDSSTTYVEQPAFLASRVAGHVVGTTSGEIYEMDEAVPGSVDSSRSFLYQGNFSSCKPRGRRLTLHRQETATSAGLNGGYQPATACTEDGYLAVAAIADDSVAADLELIAVVQSPDGSIVWRLNDKDATDPIFGVKVFTEESGGVERFRFIFQADDTLKTFTVGVDGTVSSITSVVTLNSNGSDWDVTGYDGAVWFLIYQSGATTTTFARYSGTTQTHSVGVTTTDLCKVSIWASRDQANVWIGTYNDPTGVGTVAYRVYTAAALVLVLGATTITTGASIYGAPWFGPVHDKATTATTAFFVVPRRGSAVGSAITDPMAALFGTATTAGSVSAALPLFNLVPVSKPDNRQRFWAMSMNAATASQTGSAFTRFFLLRVARATDPALGTSPTIIELATPELLVGPLGTTIGQDDEGKWKQTIGHQQALQAVSSTTGYQDGRYTIALPRVTSTNSGEASSEIIVFEYDGVTDSPGLEVEAVARCLVGAGLPTQTDGVPAAVRSEFADLSAQATGGCKELGFAWRPFGALLSTSANGNGVGAGSYSYRFFYQWVDALGRIHQSAPSEPVAVTLTTASTVNLRVVDYGIGQAISENSGTNDRLSLVTARTQNGGTNYHEVITLTGWDATDGIISVGDTSPDSTIAANGFLYTDGGVLANQLAPSCRFMAKSEDRLWVGGLWDANIIEASKVIVPEEPVNFTGDASHQVVLPDDCTGLEYQDGQVCAFCSNAVYVVGGDGPNDQGAGPWPPPRALSRDVGCVDYRSVIATAAGVFFLGRLGIYVVPRGFGPIQFVGEAVAKRMSDLELTDCLAADVHEGKHGHFVRFLMAESGATSGRYVFTFDLTTGAWFEDLYQLDLATLGAWPRGFALCGLSLNTTFDPSGSLTVTNYPILYEDPDNAGLSGDGEAPAVDGTPTWSYIPTYIKTNWQWPADRTGWVRVSCGLAALEPVGSTQKLTITIQTDLNSTQSKEWTITNSEAFVYRRIIPVEQNCSGFQIQIADAATVATPTRGFRYIALTVEALPVGGVRPALGETDTG